MPMDRDSKSEPGGRAPEDLIQGRLDICGLHIDLGQLLLAPESVRGQLENLRQRLKEAGAREVTSDGEWSSGGSSVSGRLETRGPLGEREYHLGARPRRADPVGGVSSTQEVEPVADVFYEDGEVVVVCQVPGASRDDLDVQVRDMRLTLQSRSVAAWRYHKTVDLQCPVVQDSLVVEFRNGILEARLKRV